MTQRLDKVKTDKVWDPNSKLVTNGPEAQNDNKHSSSDKIGRLQISLWFSKGISCSSLSGRPKEKI